MLSPGYRMIRHIQHGDNDENQADYHRYKAALVTLEVTHLFALYRFWLRLLSCLKVCGCRITAYQLDVLRVGRVESGAHEPPEARLAHFFR